MKTLTARVDDSLSGLSPFAEIIKRGGLVAFPTETVYGLGANAMDETAVRKIFAVKNRPANNPLIAHICDLSMLETVARDVPERLFPLMRAMWPGALTIVLPKRPEVPDCVTAGGPTVAVRCPSHPVASELIRLSGVPIVAPSANLSGRPSPTCFSHVAGDLDGRIDGIIDGGPCEFGIESTVVIPVGESALKILRPGVISPEMLEEHGFEVTVDKNVLSPVTDGTPVASPGMLYRHYAPRASMELVRGSDDAAVKYIRERLTPKTGVLCFDGEAALFDGAYAVEYGDKNDPLTLSKNLFACLRKFDGSDVEHIFARAVSPVGVGLGVYNRMLRAASFKVTSL